MPTTPSTRASLSPVASLQRRYAPPPLGARPATRSRAWRAFTLLPLIGLALGASGVASAAAPKDKASVEIIEFADFQCPFSARATQTLAELRKTYGDSLTLSYYHLPLAFHVRARAAAIASEAARNQGKFEAMHDLLFANQREQSDEDLRRYAGKVGLDLARYDRDIADPKLAEIVQRHELIAGAVGASGTPTFFVNGRVLAGAQPVESFATIIDEEIAAAGKESGPKWREKRLEAANPALYRYIIKKEVPSTLTPPKEPTPGTTTAPGNAAEVELQGPPIAIPLANAPMLGAAGAPVEIVMFAGLQCPFSAKALPKFSDIVKAGNGRYTLRWKHLPLAMHAMSRAASEAAVCAGEQGAFWEFAAKASETLRMSDQADVDKLVAAAKLNKKAYAACVASGRGKRLVEQDLADAAALGVVATPTIFVNGLRLSRWNDEGVQALLDALGQAPVQPDPPKPE